MGRGRPPRETYARRPEFAELETRQQVVLSWLHAAVPDGYDRPLRGWGQMLGYITAMGWRTRYGAHPGIECLRRWRREHGCPIAGGLNRHHLPHTTVFLLLAWVATRGGGAAGVYAPLVVRDPDRARAVAALPYLRIPRTVRACPTCGQRLWGREAQAKLRGRTELRA